MTHIVKPVVQAFTYLGGNHYAVTPKSVCAAAVHFATKEKLFVDLTMTTNLVEGAVATGHDSMEVTFEKDGGRISGYQFHHPK